MSAIVGSYVCTVLLAKRPPSSGVDPVRWRWRRGGTGALPAARIANAGFSGYGYNYHPRLRYWQ
jgi:hypothetical protein